MSGSIELVKNGVALDISDMRHYAVESSDGFGMAPLHRITERGPLQHGQTDRGYRLDARLIQMVIALRAGGWSEMYARRRELLSFLSPMSDCILRHTQPDGTMRQIGVRLTDGPTFSSKDRLVDRVQRAAIRLTCDDPAWYDPERKSIRATGGSGGTGFQFPGAVPWQFGGSSVDVDVVVDYGGDWVDYPELQVNGPIENARIENQDTGDVLEFSGLIDAGEYVVIDLRYGAKTVIDGAGDNRISMLTGDSNLATWRLVPGPNTINFSGGNAGAATSLVVRWYDRYLGV